MKIRSIQLTKSEGKALLFWFGCFTNVLETEALVKFFSSFAGSTLFVSLIAALPVWLNYDLSLNLCLVILSGCNMQLSLMLPVSSLSFLFFFIFLFLQPTVLFTLPVLICRLF